MVFGRYDYAAFSCFVSYAMCVLVIPVALDSMAGDLAFPLEGGGMGRGGFLQLARSILMILSLLACGVLSGLWGKRATLAMAIAFMGAGIAIVGVAPIYGIVLLAVCIAGLGEGVIEGLATPFVQDLHPAESGRYLNFTHAFWPVGVIAAALGTGGLLYWGVSWRWIVAGVGLLAVVPALLFIWPDRKGIYHETNELFHWREIWAKTKVILARRRFWVFFAAMFFGGGGEFGLSFWVASFVKVEMKGSDWAGGFAIAVFALGMAVSRMACGWWVHQTGLKRLVILTGVASIGMGLLFPWVTSMSVLYVLLFLTGAACAPFWPSIQSYAVDRLSAGLDSTMLLILLSCAGIPGGGMISWMLGVVGDWRGLRVSLYIVPACFVVMTLLMVWGTRRESSSQCAS